MRFRDFAIGIGVVSAIVSVSSAVEPVRGRNSLVLSNAAARLVVDLAGGAIGDFRRAGNPVNPLQWATPAENDSSVRGFGHFLCLDRWGPPSDAEGARGMPYHGEASNVPWSATREVAVAGRGPEAEMVARLPKAGLSIRRTIRMSGSEAVFSVVEEVTNENALGRVYNAVQHPTIGPPFLDGDTVVDCNGRRGFAQGGSLPDPEEPSTYWPRARNADGESVDMRRLRDDPNPNVVSYAIDESLGWVTATSAKSRLLLGYVWSTADYPWVSLWRDVRDGRPVARGLEFGTTGLHQPFPVLVEKGRIWERRLFEYLDAGATARKAYLVFLLEVPTDFAGVAELALRDGRLTVKERATTRARELSMAVDSGLMPWGRNDR